MIPEVVRQAINRPVTREELREALEGPISVAEREQLTSLCRWFLARYPSPEARLAYVRQAYARWAGAAGMPPERRNRTRNGELRTQEGEIRSIR
jgi:hypothetical protein